MQTLSATCKPLSTFLTSESCVYAEESLQITTNIIIQILFMHHLMTEVNIKCLSIYIVYIHEYIVSGGNMCLMLHNTE